MTLFAGPVLADPTRPVVVVAFGGWSDAGWASTGAVDYLAEVGETELLARLDDDAYYDHQVHRPAARGLGADWHLDWPGVRLQRTVIDGREFLLLDAPEPSHRWRSFADALLRLVEDSDPQGLVLLASRLVDTPHTRPVPVVCVTPDVPLAGAHQLALPDTEGRVGIGAVVLLAARRRGLPAMAVTAGLPHYRATEPSVGAAFALVLATAQLTATRIPTAGFKTTVEAERAEIDDAARADEDLAEHVAELEARWDAQHADDHLVIELEEMLRGRC